MTEQSPDGPTFRHSAREAALQALFAMDLQHKGAEVAAERRREGDRQPEERREPDVEALFETVLENFEMPTAARKFARELVLRVSEHMQDLDAVITSHTRNWRVARMAAVDRNVLRLATFELRHTETPAAVVLDEAVELARRFGSETSPAFVNGILDSIAHESRGAETA